MGDVLAFRSAGGQRIQPHLGNGQGLADAVVEFDGDSAPFFLLGQEQR